MEKIILVDGNNLLFRSYYATAYNGNFMKNSKGFPTNALFGFTNMMNKIINEEKPTHIIVAFDKGKTFRHEMYDNYKGERIETPNELKQQFPKAKDLLDAMGIKWYEIDNYEADDILGTFAKYCDLEENFVGTIISSDKDLLQLLSKDVDIKLLKQKDYIRYDVDSFEKEYGIKPINIIDLKALMGDPSDNIPGVKGVGEKTALKLLQEYKTLDGIYENIDKISGKLKQKLELYHDDAYFSYRLATIVRDVPMDINIKDIIYKRHNHEKLMNLYEELEFYSFIKKEKKELEQPLEVKIIKNINDVKIDEISAVYLELLGTNYHTAKILGMAIYNKNTSCYIPFSILKENPSFLNTFPKYTYDLKKNYVSLKYQGIDFNNCIFDTMIASSLLDYNVKEDIAYLANSLNVEIPFYETVFGKSKLKEPDENIIASNALKKAKFIYDTVSLLKEKIEELSLSSLFEDIEMPLALVLGNMEYNGVWVDKEILKKMGEELKIKIDEISSKIYELADTEFNISSPKQLGEILFEKLNLPHGKKGSTGYSTSIDVLHKLRDKHDIIEPIMDYRMLTKIYSTYIEGLLACVLEDGKIHTIYTQTLTRTGRLSSIEPNLQNIPIRNEYGKMIRKAFVPSENSVILSGDYSQIELRILAHMADVSALKEAFYNEVDIHTKTASDIFKVSIDEVTSEQRRMAKAVNFGIIYGISQYGLGENLEIPAKEAKKFIENYLETYPGIKEYMDSTKKKAYEDLTVKTLFGRLRTISELDSTNFMIRQQGERIALNTPIQGTSADIIKKAMVEVDKKLKENNLKTKMIIQVHDELVFDMPSDEIEIAIPLIIDVMENVVELNVPLKVEVSYGNDWYEAK